MSLRKYFKIKTRNKIKKVIAIYLAISLLVNLFYPTCAFALTGGPSQPEVQSFEPVGTSDMVDLFSGDFNYNIPLLDIDGYPVNIGYHSGITMDQEASWVGLGWNINPGVINRNMRGIPDDFNGDIIEKEFNIKPNRTFGLSTGLGAELFGTDNLNLGIQYTIGVHYNNYNGLGIEKSLNLSLSAGNSGKSPLSGGLGITSSSDEGLTIQPSLSFSASISKSESASSSLTASVGTSFNSRAGLKNLTIGVSANVQANTGETKSQNYKEKEKGKKITKSRPVPTSASYGQGVSTSFDFGSPTYTPNVTMPMQNLSVTGNFKLGFEIYGVSPNFTIGGFYSAQSLAESTVSNPAFGYMNSEKGENFDFAILDFNREKDGVFSTNTPALPVTNFTYDIYSVSGQGTGGSYRPFRSDIGHVFDASSYTTSDGYSIGAEVGIANLFHAGVDVTVNSVDTRSGRWSDDNVAAQLMSYRGSTNDPLYEPYYFKEANEKSVDNDPDFFTNTGSYDVRSVHLNQLSKFNTIADDQFAQGPGSSTIPISPINYRKKREARNQNISVLKREELASMGLYNTPNLYNAPDHHIAEITSLGTDGSRYVYGIAAYNKTQNEVTFATGKTITGVGGRTANAHSGLVNYYPGDNSKGNQNGLDRFYSNTKMPAYAHSYLLTAVLSSDYVDNDAIRGPSVGDLGSYTKFNYVKVDNYKWRVPFKKLTASHNEGLKSLEYDDKGNYLYGEKELWYLNSIETKNYIALFFLEPRKDARGVIDENGGIDYSNNNSSMLLRKITLYSKKDPTLPPIKEVHFEYNYSLCPGVDNNTGATENVSTPNGGTVNLNQDRGKLTLKKIFFTYQNSNKARLSPYVFNYASNNPPYNLKGYDRWGNYKPNSTYGFDAVNDNLSSAEFPYVDQTDFSAINNNAQAWTLKSIDLPSGGKIEVGYESDDYGYVQNKRAMQMFKVIDVQAAASPSLTTAGTSNNNVSKPINFNNGTRLIVQLQDPITGTNKDEIFKTKYLDNIDYLYFRFLMSIKPNKYEFVSGYLIPDDINFADCRVTSDGLYGCISIKNTSINDDGPAAVCPITKAAVQFGRLNMPKEVWNNSDINIGDNSNFGEPVLEAIIGSSFFKNISEAIDGPNKTLYERYDVGHEAVMNKSWVRLFSPSKRKLGGGLRVTQIRLSNEWHGMTNNVEDDFNYGQDYSYNNEDGTSSGVASYEPQLGGDENPWKTPIFFETKLLLAPDDQQYMEEPFGEMFFPSPSVGYSRVTVKNMDHLFVTKHATGSVVHEFYTAKDFPTITDRTSLSDGIKREKDDPLSIASLLKINIKDYMTVSQGYIIELNDMHGKPKSQKVYEQNKSTPISSIEYHYKKSSYLNGSYRLDNHAEVIYDNGNHGSAEIGVLFDFVSDMRQHKTDVETTSINGNIDGFMIPPCPVPIPIPVFLPSYAKENTRFRSAVITKVIQRFGILEKTVAKDLGSIVETRTLAFDAETGDVLLTQTTTDFNDPVYSMTYPAHWHYDGMGPAYKNIGVVFGKTDFVAGAASISNALKYFTEGDELSLDNSLKAWVMEVNPGGIIVMKKDGSAVTGKYSIKVIRSGRRNQQSAPMATILSLNNPIASLKSNIYDNIIDASAIEYTNKWRTFCDCFDGFAGSSTTNPYVLGTKGFWKKKREYTHLTARTQTNYNNNTNVRKDGVFTSYIPFYKLVGDKWQIDGKDWTFASEVTEYSPFGFELENRDALGIYTSAQYGYNQTLPVAVASNSKYQNMAAENFEDYGFSPCSDNHFYKTSDLVGHVNQTEAHTGRNSIMVESIVSIEKQLIVCDLQDCNLTFAIETDIPNNTAYTISGGFPPYNVEWSIISGSPVVNLIPPGNKIDCYGTGSFEVEVIVSDSKGCRRVQTIKN